MAKIKLKEWADKHGLSYLTANRHFHAGMIPGATQLDSGTILVEDDDSSEQTMANSSNDAMSLFLKKTVEFSKNNSSVEDFAAYVISNFTLKIAGTSEPTPKYSKNKPRTEEVQKHFQQFLPDKEKQERLKAVKEFHEKRNNTEVPVVDTTGLFNKMEPGPFSRVLDPDTGVELGEGFSEVTDIQTLMSSVPQILDHMYGPSTVTTTAATATGLVNRSVDFDTTPQQINYTGSNNQFFSSGSVVGDGIASNSMPAVTVNGGVLGFASCAPVSGDASVFGYGSVPVAAATNAQQWNFVGGAPSAFQPTQKELQSSIKVIETAETEDAPRGKRGRKPSKKR